MNVELSWHDDVALIAFDDGKKNSLSLDALRDISEALDVAEAKAAAIVLSGRPGSFCAGFDMKTMLGEDRAASAALGTNGGRIALRLYESGKPLVAASAGHAFTIGALWLLACDTRIGERGRYKYAMTETALGVPLGPWCMALLQDKLSPTAFVPVVAQSKVLDPEGALQAGFLDELVAKGQSVEAALAAAAALAELPAEAYARNKLSTRGASLDVMRSDLMTS